MASALVTTTPSRDHPLVQKRSLSSSPISKQKTSPQRSPYFNCHSDPLQDEEKDTQHCGLSPRRVHSLPRAWERRPATPYVARNDAQKIWKRVPLGVVSAADGQKWRKETTKLNTRPVKRLRVAHLEEDEDKENVRYIGSKWEDDGLATPSPKRKALECGVLPAREQDSIETDELEDDNEQLDKSDHDIASPELGIPRVSDIHADEAPDEAGDNGRLDVLDVTVPLLESEELNAPSSAVTDSPPTSESTEAMASLSNTLTKSASAHSAPGITDEEGDVAMARSTLASVETSVEDENEAYLWGFLSRTKARKEAKEHAEQENPILLEEATQSEEDEVEELALMYLDHMPMTTLQSREDPTDLPPVDQPEAPLSPRRSSRLTTRLPIPQKSVSKPSATITLKRLNGAEFVANNRETQSIAVATRQNTKSNKFAAIPVKIRLFQLTAEAKARESTIAFLGAPNTSNEETTTSKRRKRKKVVWSETLATYQDGSEPLKDSVVRDKESIAEIVTAVAQGQDGPPPDAASESESEPNPSTESKQETLADQSLQGLLKMLKEKDKNKASKGGVRKVRNLRRLNGGSVNGTPAPKKFTNTQLPVPVGSKIPTFGPSSSMAEKAKSVDGAQAQGNGSEAVKAEEGVQTRTRSRNLKSV
ncbi:hypothetical protein H2200_007139 [Cladophialophora chaetospira]|uniref:Uncharacterized protein n=1 Tax=Cladophialophora chaetospira TaxID=386627 RepID=A0AA38X7C7_9EURO|nr:hypothetical protein H2200_007139 [Cladophialophora chaetospira]